MPKEGGGDNVYPFKKPETNPEKKNPSSEDTAPSPDASKFPWDTEDNGLFPDDAWRRNESTADEKLRRELDEAERRRRNEESQTESPKHPTASDDWAP